jgi:hypothetical protein
MNRVLCASLLLLLFATPLFAAGLDSSLSAPSDPLSPPRATGLGTPTLSEPIHTARFFDPDRLLTTGGVKYQAADQLSLEPELGLGYRATDRDFLGGIATSSHYVHAQAGWRLSLADTLYVSAAAKLPVLTIESAGRYNGQDLGTREGYDFTHPLRNNLNWTGEMGIHLTSWTDLTLYYDQSPVSTWLTGPGGRQLEERVGTRIILRFK